jgi:hypothetical protein
MELDLNHVTVNGTGNQTPHFAHSIAHSFSVVSTQIAFTTSEALLKATGSADAHTVACVGMYCLALPHSSRKVT